MKPKIILSNWSHRHNLPGGTESRYQYLKQIFPDAELISYIDLFEREITDHKLAAARMDKIYIQKFLENNNLLIIRDDSVGGIIDTSHIPQITIFGNPYKSLSEVFDFGREYWKGMIYLQKKAKNTIKVANSNFSANDMKKIGLIPDKIIPNPVDINFFKPLNKEELRKKYGIPKNKRIGMWAGISNKPLKNVKMISRILNSDLTDIFWILVVKNKTECQNKNAKLFVSVDQNTMKELYNCADFYLLTSPVEGCCHTIFEAMACDLPCIVSRTGYFWDFWDDRVGMRIKWDDFNAHVGAVNEINNIKTSPRKVLIKQKLDLESWKKKWEELVNENINTKP